MRGRTHAQARPRAPHMTDRHCARNMSADFLPTHAHPLPILHGGDAPVSNLLPSVRTFSADRWARARMRALGTRRRVVLPRRLGSCAAPPSFSYIACGARAKHSSGEPSRCSSRHCRSGPHMPAPLRAAPGCPIGCVAAVCREARPRSQLTGPPVASTAEAVGEDPRSHVRATDLRRIPAAHARGARCSRSGRSCPPLSAARDCCGCAVRCPSLRWPTVEESTAAACYRKAPRTRPRHRSDSTVMICHAIWSTTRLECFLWPALHVGHGSACWGHPRFGRGA
jgi:hypothetical protein